MFPKCMYSGRLSTHYRSLRASLRVRHKLWLAQYGKPDGKPVVFLHGGCVAITSQRWLRRRAESL